MIKSKPGSITAQTHLQVGTAAVETGDRMCKMLMYIRAPAWGRLISLHHLPYSQ